MPARYPERIVCLTEESTETLYLLGEERRIVGISGYTVRPARARREKPRVSAFQAHHSRMNNVARMASSSQDGLVYSRSCPRVIPNASSA